MDLAVQTFALTKRFKDFVAVDRIDLEIKAEVFGMLGPNGAGKTTLARMLTTVLQPTEGTATVAGADIRREPGKVRERIGVVAQAMTLDVELTAWENLDIYGKYYGVPRTLRHERIKELLQWVGLAERARDPVGGFSGGMKRRLEIVRSLVHQPQILFLDEPTTGLDPQARAAVWDHLVAIHKDQGITLVITTHYMDEAEGLCDRLAIIDHGKIVALGSPNELKRKVSGGDIVEAELSTIPEAALGALEKADFVLEVKKRDNFLTILVRNGAEAVPRIVELVDANRGKIKTITLRALTLDDVFLHFTGRSLRE
jgi:ABC-2 type transport system ATP-binding protein